MLPPSKGGSMASGELIPEGQIEQTILFMREQKVMLDVDLARVYGVTPKRLREQVRRNHERFPTDFMFQLSKEELLEVAAICGNLGKLKYSPFLPFAFTEHGAIMLASVLNSKVAVKASIQVVRAFIRLREILASHKVLARKLATLEKRYDENFKEVFTAIHRLMAAPDHSERKIGFLRNRSK